MLSKRIIACLDVRNGQVVKGVNFEGLRNAGDPAELAERYNEEGIDEVVILDVTATLEGRRALAATVSAVAKRIFIPLTVGGGIRSEDDASAAIDAKWVGGKAIVYARSGQSGTEREAVEWAQEAADRGAGEILLTSIDRDGTKSGFDCELTAAVSRAVPIPVIASGGAGTFEHFEEVFTGGRADAALAASVFHFGEHAVAELKTYL